MSDTIFDAICALKQSKKKYYGHLTARQHEDIEHAIKKLKSVLESLCSKPAECADDIVKLREART